MSIRNGFLVTGMPVDRPGRQYCGVDTGAWPMGISAEALRDEAEKGYINLSCPVLLDEDNAISYYVNCIESHIPARLLFCQCSGEASGFPAQSLPHTLRLKLLGYDYAYPSGDYFSSILNEVLYGKSGLAGEWEERLNQYGLLASEADVSAYIKRREQLVQECGEEAAFFEKGTFSVFRLFEVKLL